MNFIESFKATRRAAVPVVAVETFDQQGTIQKIMAEVNGHNEFPIMQWDIIRGLVPLNDMAVLTIREICKDEEPQMVTSSPPEMLGRILNVPERAITFLYNAHRFYNHEAVSQGICNIRDAYKSIGATLVLLMPSASLPEELKQDIVMLTEPLPNFEEIKGIINSICSDAGIEKVKDVEKVGDTLIGLSSFAAEQTLATCIVRKENGKIDINRESLWERKCKAIEQTPGLSIWRGGETFDDIGGCDNVKNFVSRIVNGKEPPRAIVFMDEIEKAFAGTGSDSSGVSQDQLGAILSFMQDKEADGMIFIGPPGAAKSAVAKAAGNTGNIPTISFDLGAMKNSLVGKSGEQTRGALKVIDAISQGRMLFIATCNSIGVLPPELRRRFTMGTFFFDLPTKEERKSIWDIYLKKYNVSKDTMPEDEGWTGAEIKQCVKLSAKLDISFIEASKYIVPVSKSASEQIKTLKEQASGKFISASKSGIYNCFEVETSTKTGRKLRV